MYNLKRIDNLFDLLININYYVKFYMINLLLNININKKRLYKK